MMGRKSFPRKEFLNGWLCVLDPSLIATESAPEDGRTSDTKEHFEWRDLLSYCQGAGERSEKHP